jgi:hypothetical protein
MLLISPLQKLIEFAMASPPGPHIYSDAIGGLAQVDLRHTEGVLERKGDAHVDTWPASEKQTNEDPATLTGLACTAETSIPRYVSCKGTAFELWRSLSAKFTGTSRETRFSSFIT